MRSSDKGLSCCASEPSLSTALFLVFSCITCMALAQVCTCRDDESTSVLRDAGISAQKVWTTRDVVFSLDRRLIPQYQATRICEPHRGDGGSPTTLTACWIRIARYAKLIDAPARIRYGRAVGQHTICVADYDVRARDEIHAMYKNNSRVTAPVARSVDEVLAIYSHSDAVISGRDASAHSGVAGWNSCRLPSEERRRYKASSPCQAFPQLIV